MSPELAIGHRISKEPIKSESGRPTLGPNFEIILPKKHIQGENGRSLLLYFSSYKGICRHRKKTILTLKFDRKICFSPYLSIIKFFVKCCFYQETLFLLQQPENLERSRQHCTATSHFFLITSLKTSEKDDDMLLVAGDAMDPEHGGDADGQLHHPRQPRRGRGPQEGARAVPGGY
jgi:hypothetical protein